MPRTLPAGRLGMTGVGDAKYIVEIGVLLSRASQNLIFFRIRMKSKSIIQKISGYPDSPIISTVHLVLEYFYL